MKNISNLNEKYDSLLLKDEERTSEDRKRITEFEELAEDAANQGNFYLAAKCFKEGAFLLSQISTNVETNDKRDAALMFDQASRMYHAINHFSEAASCIELSADLYIKIGGKALKQAIKCYGLAKNYYGDSGDYDKCGEAYLCEMECKRQYYLFLSKSAQKRKMTFKLKHLKYASFKWVTGYGEKLSYLFIFSSLLVICFTAIYYFLGAVEIPGATTENPFYFVKEDRWAYLEACFKFSISLFSGFSTTPYLLIQYNWISTIQVIAGNLVLAIFIAIILRKISRR